MNNPFEETADAEGDLDRFAAWLEETAQREGTSTDELLGQLVNTHWILSELTELVEEGQFEASASSADTTGSAPEDSSSELIEVVRAITESQSSSQATQPSQGTQAIDPSVLELIRAINGGQGAQQPAQPAAGGGMSYRDVRAMVEDITAVEDDIDRLREEVADTVGGLESTVADLTDAVQDNTATIERLEADGADRAQRLDAMESRFEGSFGDIREILTHLIDATNEQDASIEAIVDTYEDEMAAVKAQAGARDSLADLKQDAARRDITKAACGGCDQSFRVSLLGEPACPHCDREIEGFTSTSGSLGRSSHVARVSSLPEPGDTSRLSERVERASASATSSSGAPSPEDLDWWESASDR